MAVLLNPVQADLSGRVMQIRLRVAVDGTPAGEPVYAQHVTLDSLVKSSGGGLRAADKRSELPPPLQRVPCTRYLSPRVLSSLSGWGLGRGRMAPPKRDSSLKIKDLVVSMSSVELDLFRHDRPQRRTSRHSVDSAGKVEFRLHLP